MVIPEHVQIEPVTGYCTSSCTMCTIEKLTRDRNIMSVEMFETVLSKFLPYRDRIKYVSLTGMGESLLDKNLIRKIKIAKEMGFHGIGFTTNCSELNDKRSWDIINSGLDTMICSIDGVRADTHESIRKGTDFEQIVANVNAFIELRNKIGTKPRVIIRFVRQESNKNEWPEFFEYWSQRIKPILGDEVAGFDVVNWGQKVDDYADMDVNPDVVSDNCVCEEVFKRMLIYSDGRVALCCGDDDGFFEMGNVLETDPVEIYNNEIFLRYRTMMQDGRLLELDHCKDCTIPRSRSLREKDRDSKIVATGD